MSAGRWLKMIIGGLAVGVGGPALVYYVSPSEEEIFKKYNPELQRRSLENRQQKQQEFDEFVNRLKDYSKSDKSTEDERRKRDAGMAQQRQAQREELARREEIKSEALK